MLARAYAAFPRSFRCRANAQKSARAGSVVNKRFERVGKGSRDVEPGLLGDFDESGRAGDVYLGQEIAYDVESHHEQAFCCEFRSDAQMRQEATGLLAAIASDEFPNWRVPTLPTRAVLACGG